MYILLTFHIYFCFRRHTKRGTPPNYKSRWWIPTDRTVLSRVLVPVGNSIHRTVRQCIWRRAKWSRLTVITFHNPNHDHRHPSWRWRWCQTAQLRIRRHSTTAVVLHHHPAHPRGISSNKEDNRNIVPGQQTVVIVRGWNNLKAHPIVPSVPTAQAIPRHPPTRASKYIGTIVFFIPFYCAIVA